MPDRPDAPTYAGEGPHALWHVSEDPGIERFEPHVPASNPAAEPAVWAVDTRHQPLFWFPRECPRGCIWRSGRESDADRERFFGHTDATRMHVTELAWLDRMGSTSLYLYRLPAATFRRHEVGGYWISDEVVEPVDVLVVDDLLARHVEAGIELRFVPSIWPWWRAVADSTLDFSGSRLANAADHPLRMV